MAAKRKSTPRKLRSRGRRLAARRRDRRKVSRRKASPYRSAVSMITFYLNRGGRTLPRAAKKVLRQAKSELSKLVRRSR